MSKKVMLLAVMAISAAMLAVPAMASALIPLHSTKVQTGSVSGGAATLSGGFGEPVNCTSVTGSVIGETTTTGRMTLTFHGCHLGTSATACTTTGLTSGTIETTSTPYHLVTVKNKPGILVTPNAATGIFAHFVCGILNFTVGGNGIVGTITSPSCGAAPQKTVTVNFVATGSGVQEHTTVDGTETEYKLSTFGFTSAENAEGTVTYPEADHLICT